MNTQEYNHLVNRLDFPSDIGKLARDKNLNRELLLILYTQRVTRDSTRRYYQVKNRAHKLLSQWKAGSTLAQIARNEIFPPVLLSLILMQQHGMPRKEFWKYIRDPKSAPDKRIKKEFIDVVREDIIYSPAGMDVQYQRGKKGEARLCEWLDKNGLGYRTEDEIRGEYQKTPDCLLNEPVEINGMKVHWFESKANFGSAHEVKRNNKKQIHPYTEIFGPGIIVYWFGYVSDCEQIDGVKVVDASYFNRSLKDIMADK
ncbi:MAG: TPD domain-containing protein [Thermoplasmata archaeon]|nr:TPD domain-containing protein [Thermoplasmata archaeon]